MGRRRNRLIGRVVVFLRCRIPQLWSASVPLRSNAARTRRLSGNPQSSMTINNQQSQISLPSPLSPLFSPLRLAGLSRQCPSHGRRPRQVCPEKLELLWTFPTTKGGFESTAAIVDGVVYIGCDRRQSLRPRSGRRARSAGSFRRRWGSPPRRPCAEGRVYIGDSDGTFYCLDAATGRKLWEFQTDGEIDSSANFHGGHVLFGSQDTFLYCLDAGFGQAGVEVSKPRSDPLLSLGGRRSRLRGRLRWAVCT